VEPRRRPTRHHQGSPTTVSVDELIIRCGEWQAGPPPGVDYGAPATISVASLLRREGLRGPHAADPRLQPRGHSRPAVEPPRPPRHSLRKATAAAGALFAAGAMFATAVVETVVRAPGGGIEFADGGLGHDVRRDGPATGKQSDTPENFAFTVERAFAPAALVGPSPFVLPQPGIGPATGGFDGLLAVPDPFDRPGGQLAAGAGAGGGAAPAGFLPGAGSGTGGPVITAPGGGGAEGGPGVSIPLPDLGTPEIQIPGGVLPGLPGGGGSGQPGTSGGGGICTPQVTVSPGEVRTPDLGLSGGGGSIRATVSDTALITPDVAVSEVEAGPAQLSPAEVELPDVQVTGGGATLSRDAAPQVAVPGVSVSGTKLVTPDVELGPVRVPLPDVKLSEVAVPQLKVDVSKPGAAVGEAATAVVGTVGQVGTGVVSTATDVVGQTVGGVGETLGSVTGSGRSQDTPEPRTTTPRAEKRTLGDTLGSLTGSNRTQDTSKPRTTSKRADKPALGAVGDTLGALTGASRSQEKSSKRSSRSENPTRDSGNGSARSDKGATGSEKKSGTASGSSKKSSSGGGKRSAVGSALGKMLGRG
jgi:hypothetical protein